MSSHRYPKRALLGDYLRAASGVAVGLIGLIAVPLSWVTATIFTFLVVIFGVFGLRTALRQTLRIDLENQRLTAVSDLTMLPFVARQIPLAELRQVKLRYFGSRRKAATQANGFFQLTVKGAGGKISCDSALEGFSDVVREVFIAARKAEVALDSTTIANLISLGIDPTSPHSPEDLPEDLVASGQDPLPRAAVGSGSP